MEKTFGGTLGTSFNKKFDQHGAWRLGFALRLKLFDLYDSKMQFCASSFCQIQFNLKKLKKHSTTSGSAGILPAFGGRDARAPRGYLISLHSLEHSLNMTALAFCGAAMNDLPS